MRRRMSSRLAGLRRHRRTKTSRHNPPHSLRPAMGTASPTQRKRRRLFHIQLQAMLREVSGHPRARLSYTLKWVYENKYCAVIHGLPHPLHHCRPSQPRGGKGVSSALIKYCEEGKVSIHILPPETFARRRDNAIAAGVYTPDARRGTRADAGYPRPHARRAERLFPATDPVTTEGVTKEMEDGTYPYPERIQPRRVSNVERRKREEKVSEAAATARKARRGRHRGASGDAADRGARSRWEGLRGKRHRQ